MMNSNAPPAKRRITPIAVSPVDQVNSAAFAAEQPLRLGPAPMPNSTKGTSVCEAGRRIWVDIQDTITIKFKDVLRQQGLDYGRWKLEVEQRRAKLEGAHQARHQNGGADAKRQGFTGRLYQRVQGLYEASDDGEEASDQNDTDEAGTASDAAAEGGGGDGDEAAGSEGDDDEEDDEDEDDDKEGNETGAEIDLDKEEEADKSRKPKPKRQRFERYDEDFIDDSELEMVKGATKDLKTKFTGFYAVQGDVELIEQPSKPRSKPKPRAPRAAPDTAKPDGTTATGAASATAGSKKRKQPEKQQQDKQQQAANETDAAAVNGADGTKKKRQRSETPNAAAGPTADKPPKPKKVKPTPVSTLEAAAAGTAAPDPAAADTGDVDATAGSAAVASAPPAAGAGTAQRAIAAALAAKQQRIQPEKLDTAGHPAAAAGGAPTSSATSSGNAMATPAPAAAAARQQQPSGQQQLGAPAETAAILPATAAETADPGIAPDTTTTTPPAPAAAADASQDTTYPEAAAAAVEAGLPADLVSAVRTLQEKVVEHKPSGNAQLSKPVKQALRAVGITFFLLPTDLQQQHEDTLVQVLKPLMLPYGKEKKLRKELFEAPKQQLDEAKQKMCLLLQHLEQMKQQQGIQAADAGTDDDDFQSAPWTPEAEQALVEAWKAAEAQPVGQPLQQMATEVFSTLGRTQQQPERAVEELRHIYTKAKKKASRGKEKKDQQQASVVNTPLRTGLQQQPSVSSLDAAASLPGSRQSPAPESLVVAAAAAGSGHERSTTPAPTPVRVERSASVGMAANLLSQAAGPAGPGPSAAVSGGSLLTQAKKEQEKFSSWLAPSPRLQRCLESAEAAGASRDWLERNYPKAHSATLNQIYRVLCLAGPQGCSVKGMVLKATEYQLGFAWDDNTNQRSAITQSLHTMSGRSMVGVTDTDPAAFALQGFTGVLPQPAKPAKQPKPASDAAAESTAEEGVQPAAEQ